MNSSGSTSTSNENGESSPATKTSPHSTLSTVFFYGSWFAFLTAVIINSINAPVEFFPYLITVLTGFLCGFNTMFRISYRERCEDADLMREGTDALVRAYRTIIYMKENCTCSGNGYPNKLTSESPSSSTSSSSSGPGPVPSSGSPPSASASSSDAQRGTGFSLN